jgi:hypothetical protein
MRLTVLTLGSNDVLLETDVPPGLRPGRGECLALTYGGLVQYWLVDDLTWHWHLAPPRPAAHEGDPPTPARATQPPSLVVRVSRVLDNPEKGDALYG